MTAADGRTAKTIWHLTMSLDGYMADHRGALDWMAAGDNSPAPLGTALIPWIGAILAGRRTYDGGIEGDDSRPYGGAYKGPVFVLTHRPDPAHTSGAILLTDGLPAALTRARTAANGRDVVIFGANLGQQCLDAGELDEILVHIAPVLIGAGTPAFARGTPGLRAMPVLQRSEAEHTTTLRLAAR